MEKEKERDAHTGGEEGKREEENCPAIKDFPRLKMAGITGLQ
jgi:hypothetical protein